MVRLSNPKELPIIMGMLLAFVAMRMNVCPTAVDGRDVIIIVVMLLLTLTLTLKLCCGVSSSVSSSGVSSSGVISNSRVV